jgi:hypothetical protein
VVDNRPVAAGDLRAARDRAGVGASRRQVVRTARRRAWCLGLIALPLVVGGCAAGQSTRAPAAPHSAADAAAAVADYYANTPPAAARMICSDDIRGQVARSLNLGSVAAPRAAWADHVYTCTYTLPMGQLVLSVTVAPSDNAARGELQAMRGRLPDAQEQLGLGRQAYGSAAGTLIAEKDNMVLQVDATRLPDDLGSDHEPRLFIAQAIAAGVFDCWSGP